MKKSLKALLIAVLGFECLYIVAALIFLNFGFPTNLINTSPQSLRVTYGYAYSLIPGLVRIHGLDTRIQDDNMQLEFQLHNARVAIALSDLFHRRFHATRVEGNHLALRFRLKRTATELTPRVLQALPPIDGAPSDEKAAGPPSPSAPYRGWTVQLDQVHVAPITELWIDAYHFRGIARLDGGLFLTPKTRLSLPKSVVVFERGKVFLGDREITPELMGEVECEIARNDPSRYPGWTLLRNFSGKVDLQGRLTGLGFLNYYFERSSSLHVSGGEGSIQVSAVVKQGQVQPKSDLQIAARSITLELFGQRARGEGLLTWRIEPSFLSQLSIRFGHFSISSKRPGSAALAGDGLAVTLTSPRLYLEKPLAPINLRVNLPQTEITDMRYFNGLLPEASKLSIESGQGQAEGWLHSSTLLGGQDEGRIRIKSHNLVAHYGKTGLRGNLVFNVKLISSDFKAGRLGLSGSRLELDHVTTKEQGKNVSAYPVDNSWWGSLEFQMATLVAKPNPSLTALFHLHAKNARPIFALYDGATQGGPSLPNWAIDFITFKGLALSLLLDVDRSKLRISDLEAHGDHCSLYGWLHGTHDSSQGKLLLQRGPFAVGIGLVDGAAHLRLQDAFGWYFGKSAASPLAE